MRIDKLAMTSREALQTAMSAAADAQAGAVEPIHLLSALLGAGERNISVIIERIGADPAQLARSTQDAIDRFRSCAYSFFKCSIARIVAVDLDSSGFARQSRGGQQAQGQHERQNGRQDSFFISVSSHVFSPRRCGVG